MGDVTLSVGGGEGEASSHSGLFILGGGGAEGGDGRKEVAIKIKKEKI